MFFEKDKYYKYIGDLENLINFSYAIYITIFAILGLVIYGIIGLILGILIGILIARIYTLNAKIKVQRMRWELDIYLMQKEKK